MMDDIVFCKQNNLWKYQYGDVFCWWFQEAHHICIDPSCVITDCMLSQLAHQRCTLLCMPSMYAKLAGPPTSRASPVSAHTLSKKHWGYRCALLWPSFHGSRGFKLRSSCLCLTHETRSPVPESFALLLCCLYLELPEDSICVWLISGDPSGYHDCRTVVIHADQQGSCRLGGP